MPKKAESHRGIDLTRMECKAFWIYKWRTAGVRIDLTRMECKDTTTRRTTATARYRFNQNGM